MMENSRKRAFEQISCDESKKRKASGPLPFSRPSKTARFSTTQYDSVVNELTSRLSRMVIHDELDTFTCFGKLPAELRVMIWKFAIEAPRVLKYTIVQNGPHDDDFSRIAEDGPPPVLHANRESRYEALKVKEWDILWNIRPKFFRLDIDIAHIRYAAVNNLGHESYGRVIADIDHKITIFQDVKTVAFSQEIWEESAQTHGNFFLMMVDIGITFRKLKNLIFLMKKDEDYDFVWKIRGEGKKNESKGVRPGGDWEVEKFGEFREVAYNKEYATHIEQERSDWASDMEPWSFMFVGVNGQLNFGMEVKVLSE